MYYFLLIFVFLSCQPDLFASSSDRFSSEEDFYKDYPISEDFGDLLIISGLAEEYRINRTKVEKEDSYKDFPVSDNFRDLLIAIGQAEEYGINRTEAEKKEQYDKEDAEFEAFCASIPRSQYAPPSPPLLSLPLSLEEFSQSVQEDPVVISVTKKKLLPIGSQPQKENILSSKKKNKVQDGPSLILKSEHQKEHRSQGISGEKKSFRPVLPVKKSNHSGAASFSSLNPSAASFTPGKKIGR